VLVALPMDRVTVMSTWANYVIYRNSSSCSGINVGKVY
jgi:hypothetical protein